MITQVTDFVHSKSNFKLDNISYIFTD